MKAFFTLVLTLILCQAVRSQHIVESKQFGIAFESTKLLEKYETESYNVLGYESDDYAVDMEIFPFGESHESLLSDAKYSARLIAKQLTFTKIEDGGKIPKIEEAFYVIGYDDEVPVFTLFIIDRKKKVVYEITTYCYNLNKKEGERITKSFNLIR